MRKSIIFTYLLFAVFILGGKSLYSQSISGKVIDASSSEPLIGANVKVTGTSNGAVSDIDGSFQIIDLKPGSYDLEVSYIGYTTKKILDVVVKDGDNTSISVALEVDGLTTEEIEIESSPSLANEEALLTEQKNSSKIQDGISEQQIKRAPDNSASEVLKRVMGVTILDDKFVSVRGTNERYNNTTLNGVLIPSVEPDKKSFSFDMFPSNLVENIIVSKSFTPDQPGNYSGGLVQLTTKDFPEDFTFNVTTSGAIVNGLSTKGGFYDYDASESKLLFFNSGWDDGGRNIPSNFPDQKFSSPNEYGKSLKNNWAQNNEKAPLNGGFQFSLGNKFNLFNNPLGVLFGYTYGNWFDNEEIVRKEYIGNDTATLIDYTGRSSTYKVLLGGLLNLNYKAGDNNKFGFKNTLTQSGLDETQFYQGAYKVSDNTERKNYRYAFTESRLLATQVNGSHYIHNLAKMSVNWKGYYSETRRNEPDLKTTYYTRELGTEDPFFMPLTVIANNNVGQRFYSNLFDINRGVNIDFENSFIKLAKRSPESRIKYGVIASGTDRDFKARLFAPRNAGPLSIGYEGIDTIFRPENFDSSKLYMVEITDKSDAYTAVENNYAGYLMFDMPVGKLRITTGLRIEYDEQKLNGFERASGDTVRVNTKTNDYLPTINLTYALNNSTNIRMSASQTVNRPELREIAPFSYIDFLTEGLITGNPDLQSTLIQNYDLRFETFPAGGEIVSLSLFYKHFDQPIEKVIVPTLANPNIPSYTYGNAIGGAKNYGLELELRKKLGFISKYVSDISFNGNFTLVNSKVNLEGLSTSATEKERRLQGQAPYTVNLGLYYENFDLGLNANVLFNREGDKISEVGSIGFSNVIEKGRSLLDFQVGKRFLDKFEAKFAVKNILNQDAVFTQNFTFEGVSTDRIVRQIKSSGPNYGFSLSYKF